jgi:amino acid transporter
VLIGPHRSIGGVIGTGLFLGTAKSLAAGGPLGLLLGYMIVSSACVAVMLCLGELTTLLPVAGGQVTLAGRFVDPALAFAMG